MLDAALIEEPVHLGEGGRLLGILTEPQRRDAIDKSVHPFVLLNAGLLHRAGPHRLYVRMARELAKAGFPTLRIDLAGKGDSPQRPDTTRRESLEIDFGEIVRGLQSRYGSPRFVLAGLCSGADDAIRLAPLDDRVVGLLLLDPLCFPDAGFARRAAIIKYTQPARYATWLKRRLTGEPEKTMVVAELDPLTIRDTPTFEQMRAAFVALGRRRGRVLSIFTAYALRYYNQRGQLGRVLNVDDYVRFGTELFWPEAEHVYTLDLHRRRLLRVVSEWAAGFR
jgi:pimeloyl-ACP methyl ester carboxylesterase